METIDIGTDFYYRLINRDTYQGDGTHTAVEFRTKYLSALDSAAAWGDDKPVFFLDFKNVKKIGPSFANEAFAYFTKYAKPEDVFRKMGFLNLSKVKEIIIKAELETGYSR